MAEKRGEQKYHQLNQSPCVHHNLVVSTISKSSSSESFWFNSDGIELKDVAMEVVVLRLFILLNLLINELLSTNVPIKTKEVK